MDHSLGVRLVQSHIVNDVLWNKKQDIMPSVLIHDPKYSSSVEPPSKDTPRLTEPVEIYVYITFTFGGQSHVLSIA